MTDGPRSTPSATMRAMGIPGEVLEDLCADVRERTMRALAHTTLTDAERESLAGSIVLSVRQTIASTWLHGHEHGKRAAFDPDTTPVRPVRRSPTR